MERTVYALEELNLNLSSIDIELNKEPREGFEPSTSCLQSN